MRVCSWMWVGLEMCLPIVGCGSVGGRRELRLPIFTPDFMVKIFFPQTSNLTMKSG